VNVTTDPDRAISTRGATSDGVNTVGFSSAKLCKSSLTLACTTTYGDGHDISEFDMQFNTHYEFWTGLRAVPADRTHAFDIWSVAAHEFGHAIGFAHTSDDKNAPSYVQQQVMYRYTPIQDIGHRYMGASDYTALCTLESCGS
jgi:hypothetical protein